MTYVTGEIIKTLREKKKYTQKELADKLMLSDKTISKWETNKGLPDISVLADLAEVLSVSVAELLSGEVAINKNVPSNMKRSKFYVCPICGNVIHSMGEGAFFCCGVRLPVLEAEAADEKHELSIENVENEIFIHMEHTMNKSHYITFIAYVTDCHIQMEKLYPEQTPQLRFRRLGHGIIFVYCNKHGLFYEKI